MHPSTPIHRASGLLAVLVAFPLAARADPPRFAIRPRGDEHAFAGSIYKAVVVVEGCPEPDVTVEAPPEARYRQDTLSHLPAGRAGDSFEVRIRARNADGEAAASWRVTLVDPLSLAFDDPGDYTSRFEERLERVPAVQRAGLAAGVRGGDLRIAVPATGPGPGDNLDSWCGVDRSPRWWSNLKVFGAFEIETTMYFLVPPGEPLNGYHLGLALDRGTEDLTILGPIRGGIEYERTCYPLRDGDHSPAPIFPGGGLEEVMLRITVDGTEQTYWAKRPGDAVWQVAGYAGGARPPLEGVGLAVKTWGSQTSFTAGFRDFHYRGLPPERPVIHGPDDEDWAFAGGEYTARVDTDSDAPMSLEVSPPDALLGPDGILRRQVTESAGASFTVRLLATSAAGSTQDEWVVHVVAPVRHDFDGGGELASFELQETSSSRLGEVAATVAGGELRIDLPGTDPEDFDSWCGFDRTPRWLHRLRVTGTYALETVMRFARPPPSLADGYHAGLAVDRGFADIAILGAIRRGIEYERTCSADCENTDTFLAGLFDDPAARVHLRIEASGAEQRFLARRPADAVWTEIARVTRPRPLPRGAGIAAKNWGIQGPYTAAFDFFDYGLPGCTIVAAPPGATVVRGTLYAPAERVRALGVSPRYTLAAAPAGATIGEGTGEVRWQVPADQPAGPVAFTARAACGTASATASWTVTVTTLEPNVAITSFAPPEISVLGKTPFVVRGANFTPETDVVIGGVRIDPEFIGTTELRGIAPPHAAGTVAVTVEDPLRGSAALPAATTYIGPLALAAIAPASVLEGDAIDVTVTGSAFTPETAIRVGTAALEAASFVSARRIDGRLPGTLAPGRHDLVATDGAASATRAQAFEVVPRVRIDRFTPGEISVLGKTPFEVRGANFTPETDVVIGGVRIDPELASEALLRGTAPPHAAGAVAVAVEDSVRGSAALSGAATYVGPLAVSGIDPAAAGRGQAADVTVNGVGFTPETLARVGPVSLVNPVFLDARRLRGRVPGTLPCGSYDVAVTDGGASASRTGAFSVTARPEVLSVSPYHLSQAGTTPVELHGRDFTPEMRVTFESGGESSELAFELLSATLARGLAPAHRVPGPVEIAARCGGGPESRLAGAAAYDTPALHGPNEVEATLVEGIAEFAWLNPLAFQAIHVYRQGTLIETLAGDATFYSDPTLVAGNQAGYSLVAEHSDGSFTMLPFVAAILECPEPVFPVADRGPQDFTLRGGHPGYPAPEGGGGAARAGGGGAAGLDGSFQVNAQAFPAVLPGAGAGMYNAVHPGEFYLLFNELRSGFTLFEAATKLRIEVHGAKIQGAPDLSLRLRIEGVSAGVDRAVELELPDPLVDPAHDWIDLTYNTLNPPPPPGMPPPGPGDPPLPPHPPLPPGQYLVRLYARGGELGEPFYSISSDFSNDQILVPGAGCPPYPLIRVTDTTERNSNPVIVAVEQVGEVTQFFLPAGIDEEGNPIPILKAKMRAITTDPDLPADPIVSYKWEIDNTLEVKTTSSAGPETTMVFPGYGFYLVTLTVEDQRCGFARKKVPVKIRPACVPPPPGTPGPNFTFPVPKPKDLHFVADLPGGMDSFPTPIPATFRVFAVDQGCGGQDAATQSVQFGLFTAGSSEPLSLTSGQRALVQACLVDVGPAGDEICWEAAEVANASGEAKKDGRFWKGTFPDMRLLPETPFPVFYLKARGSAVAGLTTQDAAGWGPWRDVKAYSGSTELKGVNKLRVHHKPAFLDVAAAHTTGSYEARTQSYSFLAETPPAAIAFPPTPPVPLPLVDAAFPSLENRVSRAGQRVALGFAKGHWNLESHAVDIEGVVFNGPVGGTEELLGPSGGGGGAGFDPLGLGYDFCERRTLFQRSFDWPLFDSIIWAGAIGPIYVTVRATVGLALALGLENHIELHLRGFPAAGEAPYRADFWMLPAVKVALDAAIRSDIFFGILSLRGGATTAVGFDMPVHVGVDPGGVIGPEAALRVDLDVDLWFKGCVSLLLKDICAGKTFDVLDQELVNTGAITSPVPSGCPAGGGLEPLAPGAGGGDWVVPVEIHLNSPDRQLAVASSPSGTRHVAVGRFTDLPQPGGFEIQLFSFHRSQGAGWHWPATPLGGHDQGLQSDPAVVFLDEDHVLCAWTQDTSGGDPAVPTDPDEPVDPAEFNAVTRHYEIAYKVGTFMTHPLEGEIIAWGEGNPFGDPFGPPSLLTDDPGTLLRADGGVSLAAVPGANTAWAAWVRYETEELAVAVEPPETDPCDDEAPPVTARISMQATGIVARRIAAGVPSGPLYEVSGPNGAIDIEPQVAVSPEGNAYCVWVQDADPTHRNLTDSNVGRNILFSRFAGGAWTPPQPVIADVSSLPGILEPSLALVGGGHGVLAFTALPGNADPCDTGLGNLRLLYVVLVSNAQASPSWSAPILVEKKCSTPAFAHWPLVLPNPKDVSVKLGLDLISPVILVANETGPAGTGFSLGNILTLSIDPAAGFVGAPITVTGDGALHQDVAASFAASGELITVSQSLDLSALAGGAAPGGGGEGGGAEILGSDIRVAAIPLTADPAISECRISDPAAGPGVRVAATVGITNRGHASTPVSEGGASLLRWRIYHEEEGGERTTVAEEVLPQLDPGVEILRQVNLTIPRRPVLLTVEVDGVEGERDPADNARTCALGAQPVRAVTCELLELEGGGFGVRVSWRNAGLYDSVLVYRDRALLAELPGSATSYLDLGITLNSEDGAAVAREYSVRGTLGHSRSLAAGCAVEIPGLAAAAWFRRADASADGRVNLTDAVFTLNYLFRGGPAPLCADASDANDDGRLDLTDGVYPLRFLFAGGRPIPPPGIERCGEDPTADTLAECRYPADLCR